MATELGDGVTGPRQDHNMNDTDGVDETSPVPVQGPLSDREEKSKAVKKQTDPEFAILSKQGDLFKCPKTHSLVHCVSRDLRMGKGIATLFKKMFGGVTELKKQGKKVGEVAVLEKEGRYIYYLITKEKYNNKPTYETLEATLWDMKRHCLAHGVKRISMPKIGCGLDKLEWLHVDGKLIKVFQDTDIVINVYSFS